MPVCLVEFSTESNTGTCWDASARVSSLVLVTVCVSYLSGRSILPLVLTNHNVSLIDVQHQYLYVCICVMCVALNEGIRPMMPEELDRLSKRGTTNNSLLRKQKLARLRADPPLRMRGHTRKHVNLVTPTMVQRLFEGGSAAPLRDELTAKCRVSFDSDGTGNFAQYTNKDKAIYLCNLVCKAPPPAPGLRSGSPIPFFRTEHEATVKCEFNAARNKWGVRTWSNFPADPKEEHGNAEVLLDPSVASYVAPMASEWHRSEHNAMLMKKIVVV